VGILSVTGGTKSGGSIQSLNYPASAERNFVNKLSTRYTLTWEVGEGETLPYREFGPQLEALKLALTQHDLWFHEEIVGLEHFETVENFVERRDHLEHAQNMGVPNG
jgi:hypothetical protein